MTDPAPTSRFSDRVADYVRHRPGYPPEVLHCLSSEFGLRSAHRVADIGSGTGIFTELLLQAGCTVYAVEPNAAMREAAERQLNAHPSFHSVAGSAESTTLSDRCIDWVTIAQAFHWFDVDRTRAEAARILRSPARVAVLWNNRREDTPFLRDYEAFLQEFSTDYARVKHQNAESDGRVERFFAPYVPATRTFSNAQVCDLDGLVGRTLSASYMPNAAHPCHPAMLQALRGLFATHALNGQVTIEYDTRLYVGSLQEAESEPRS